MKAEGEAQLNYGPVAVMSRSQLPLNALRAFEAAARHASFTHAAEELHVTQAAVSHQVKALEERLGVALVRAPAARARDHRRRPGACCPTCAMHSTA